MKLSSTPVCAATTRRCHVFVWTGNISQNDTPSDSVYTYIKYINVKWYIDIKKFGAPPQTESVIIKFQN